MIKFGNPLVQNDTLGSIAKIIDSGIFVHGDYTKEFEKEFGKVFGYDNCATVSSATAGLHLAAVILAKKYGATDDRNEVLCPAMTHVATINAIELAGMRPIFVDCEDTTGNVDVDSLISMISERTIGVSVVHFNGEPALISEVSKVCNQKNIFLIEDCAIALGAKLADVPVGLIGNVGVFSFHPVKQMTTGEGGMVVSNDVTLIEEINLMKAFGVDRSFSERKIPGMYDVVRAGFNYRMAEIPAAIGLSQLKSITEFLDARKNNFAIAKRYLSDINGIEIHNSNMSTGRSFYVLPIIITDVDRSKRDQLIKSLLENGIQTSIYYPHPIPRLQYYQKKYKGNPNDFPGACRIADRSVAIPIAPHIKGSDLSFLSKKIKELMSEL